MSIRETFDSAEFWTAKALRVSNVPVRVLTSELAISRSGERKLSMRLADGQIDFQAELSLCDVPFSQHDFYAGDLVHVTGCFNCAPDTLMTIEHIAVIEPVFAPSEVLMPVAYVAQPAEVVLPNLHRAISCISDPDLKLFIAELFCDWRVAVAYGNNPASSNHHHAFAGGLMIHSLEVARAAVINVVMMERKEFRDLAIVLGLVHDLGKVVTFHGMKRTDQGRRQCTDSSALEVMERALRVLDRVSPDQANVIRSFFQPRNWFPRSNHPVIEAVQLADVAGAGQFKLAGS